MRISRRLLKATFGHRDYRLLWADAVFNSVGMAGEVVLLGLLAYQVTDSSAWVGIALAVYYGPSLVCRCIGGRHCRLDGSAQADSTLCAGLDGDPHYLRRGP